jgi:peroxiredoxin Q/BCP
VGAAAPDVRALDADGRLVAFAECYDQGLVLAYFYPKAETPGCISQACSLRDAWAELHRLGIQVLGISGDRPETLRRFRKRRSLPFRLISDVESDVRRAFGVGDILGCPLRQSFLIREARIFWRDLSAVPGRHAQDILQAFDRET